MRRALVLPLLLLAACVAEPQRPTTIILVRHAEKLTGGTDPDLSPAGLARANALAEATREAHLSVAYVTQYKRTKETAAPTKARQVLVPCNIENPGDYPRRLRNAILSKHTGDVVLVVTHSNTIPAIVRELAGASVAPFPDSEYDRMTIVVLRPEAAASVVTSRYGAASR